MAELYIDPLTAHEFVQSLSLASKRKVETISFLQAISNTVEMRPLLSVRNSEISDMQEFIIKNEHFFLQQIPEDWDLDFEDFVKSVKTAMMFEDWANELTEEQILEKYKVAPGELRSRLENADWLIYSMHELALLLGHKELLNEVRKVRLRLDYGIKEELLPLVKLKQIGRVRARKLFNSNLKRVDDLRKVPLQNLEKIVGPKIAKIIKDQLEGKEVSKAANEKQSILSFD